MDINSINIKLIIKLLFFRYTSYRELSAIYKHNDSYYLLMIYPFAISLYDISDFIDYSKCLVKLKPTLVEVYHKHYQDFFRKKEIDYNPCDIFDLIYNKYLENNNLTDEPNSTKEIYFKKERLNLRYDLKSMRRNDTLNKILN